MNEASAIRSQSSYHLPEGHDCDGRERRTARWIAAAFLFYGLVATTLLGINTPPFQVADEPIHFMRAEQIADGGFVGTRIAQALSGGRTELAGGGTIDPALNEAVTPFNRVMFHPALRVKEADWAPNVHWSGTRGPASFPTANYPPFFYLPSAAGILAGRKFGLSVVQTLYLSRLLTGLIAVVIGALAIVIANGAAPWIFTILSLPMSLSLMASVSQDALLIACSALAGALLVRGMREPASSDSKLLTSLAITLSLVAMARPPFGAFAILPLGLPRMRLWKRVLASVAVVLCTLAWAQIAAATSLGNFGEIVGAHPAAQIELIQHHPLLVLKAIAAAITMHGEAYLGQLIGVLGWLDTLLPYSYYRVTAVMLAVAAAATMLGTKGKPTTSRNYLIVAAGIACAVLGVFLVQYVTWTAPGYFSVEGVEGRYFLAPTLVGGALLPSLGRIHAPRLRSALLVLIVAFPIVSLAVTMRVLVLRYYLG